jgi:hypothetical protein
MKIIVSVSDLSTMAKKVASVMISAPMLIGNGIRIR